MAVHLANVWFLIKSYMLNVLCFEDQVASIATIQFALYYKIDHRE